MHCRLLYLVGQLGAGGLERQLELLLQSMDRKRYRPEVVVWNFREDDRYVRSLRALEVPIHGFSGSASRISKLKALRSIVEQLNPEVVHSYSFHTNFAAWCATLRTKAIPVGAVQADFIYDKRRSGVLLGRLSARWPRVQIFNSIASANRARRLRSIFVPRLIRVVQNGVDLDRFVSTSQAAGPLVRIAGIGSLLPVKRWDRLIKAGALLKAKGLKFEIIIAGEGPLRRALGQGAKDLGVSDCITFAGHVDDVPALLAQSTFLVHTSDSEGLPNVIVEAMACGRAVVATDVGEVRTLVEDGKTGFVVCREDNMTLVDRLTTLIVDRKLCRLMGEAGRAKTERTFTSDRFVAETLSAYQAAGWRDIDRNDGIVVIQPISEGR